MEISEIVQEDTEVNNTSDLMAQPSTSTADSPTVQVMEINEIVQEDIEVNNTSDLMAQPSTSTADSPTSQSSTSKSTSIDDDFSVAPVQESVQSPHQAELVACLNRYEKMYFKERAKAKKYRNMLRNTKMKFKKFKLSAQSKPDHSPILQKLFNKDQLLALKKKQDKKSTKFMKWSNETITNALKLKFSCGNNGYKELLQQGFPLPSIRTLQRRLQNLKFDSGVLYEVFEFLKIKVEAFELHERDCVLVLDEMAITPGNVFDTSLNKYFEDVTLPEHTGIATHVLVFMLGGVTTRWKQVVAYHFTGNSVNGAVFKNIIESIIKIAKDLKLNILSVTSDMGSCNQALWRAWGISAGRYSPVNCKIPHPSHLDEFLYIFADIPHLFKNIKSMLITNKIIRIPANIAEKYNLPTREVLSDHIFEVLNHQETHTFKLTPKLSEEDLLPTHFTQMKVSTSTNVVSHTVSSALKFLSEELKKPAYLTTAWFLDQIEKWFYIMTSRHPSCSLSKFNIEAYNEAITFLKDFMDLFATMEVGYKKLWKPSQSGVLISTQSMLELQADLLEKKQYQFVLTSRFSQDCLENLFCVLRSKQLVPNAVQVKNNLKLICVSQYLKNSSTGSYDEDDRLFLSGFLNTIETTQTKYDDVQLPNVIKEPIYNLSNSELNSMYNVCGYILQSIKKTSKTCQTCMNAAGSKSPVFKKFTKFTIIRRFREHSLFFCNEFVFYFFLEMEIIFRKYLSIVSSQNVNLKDFFFRQMISLHINLPGCHNLKQKIIKRFITFRLKINSKKNRSASKKHASKSVAGNLL